MYNINDDRLCTNIKYVSIVIIYKISKLINVIFID